jgi:tRNA/rRNA methyltransferase
VHSVLDDALAGSAFTVACTARPREIAVPMVDAREAASRAVEVARSQPVALVFGNETFGLTAAEIGKCQLLASIPANPEYSSLNVAAAVQLFAYELRVAALGTTVTGSKARPRATHEELERLYEHLERAMVEHGFLNPEHPKKLMPRLRRLFNRAQLEREEVNILRGVIRALVQPKTRQKG